MPCESTHADTSQAQLVIAEEVYCGVNPGEGYTRVRFTSETLAQATDTTQSQEIRADRLPADLIRTDLRAQGEVNIEFSHNNFDFLIQGAMMSTWGSLVDLAGRSVNITVADPIARTARLTDAGAGDAFTNMVVGQWIKLSGFTDDENNGYVRVVAKVSNAIVDVEGLAFINESGQADIDVYAQMIRVGKVKRAFSIEKQFTDIDIYLWYNFMLVASFGLTITPGSILTGLFSFLGRRQQNYISSQAGIVAEPGEEVVANAIDNVKAIWIDGFSDPTEFELTEVSFTLDNRVRTLPAIGVLGPIDVGLGTVELTGTLNVYLVNKILIDKYTEFLSTSFGFRTEDVDGNSMIFTIPSIKFSELQTLITGQNEDVFAAANFSAEATAGNFFQIDRFPA